MEVKSTPSSGKRQLTLTNCARNFGIMIALMVLGCVIYVTATEFISAKKSKGEVLLFQRNHGPTVRRKKDVEANGDDRISIHTLAQGTSISNAPAGIQRHTSVIHWDSVNYDIKIKKEARRILKDVNGWVQAGTLTALMVGTSSTKMYLTKGALQGVTGAGKTTLLDVLASRTTIGVVSGQILVDGRLRDTGFQRKTGYVQQQDLHLATSTVREALTFSALLRQPKAVSYAEKIAYVDEVIKVLEMEAYADAAVGIPGEGMLLRFILLQQ